MIQTVDRDQSISVHFQRSDDFVERFFEGAAYRHGFAHRFHLGREGGIGAWKFLKSEPRHLHDDIIDGWLERGFGHSRDVIRDFIQRVADGEFRGNLGDGKSGRLRRQSRTRDTRGFISMTTMSPFLGSIPN